jgi:hypothetical protein
VSNRLRKKKLEQQSRAAERPPVYTVFVDDNFGYMNEDSRFTAGEFATYDAALAEAKEIVRSTLAEQFQPGMSRRQLMDQYKDFGLDPFISPGLKDQPQFSAWNYANDIADEVIEQRMASLP